MEGEIEVGIGEAYGDQEEDPHWSSGSIMRTEHSQVP